MRNGDIKLEQEVDISIESGRKVNNRTFTSVNVDININIYVHLL